MYANKCQDLSAEKTERTGRFYAKHTDSNPFQRFSVCGKNLHKSLLFRRKGDKKTARECQHFREQRMVVGGGGGN